MAVEMQCRTPDCKGVLRREAASDLLRCPTCNKSYRLARKPTTAEQGPAEAASQEASPETSAEEARPRKRRRGKRKPQRSSVPGPALLDAVVSTFTANLTMMLVIAPIAALLIGMFVYLAYSGNKKKWDEQSAQLANQLFGEVGIVQNEPASQPYVRGRLAILETQTRVKYEHQDGSKPEHWLNDYFKTPLDDPGSIGSVVVIEWQVFESMARDASGRPLGLGDSRGRPPQDEDPVMLKRWNCILRLVDRKRRQTVYRKDLVAPDRTFSEGQKVLTTPGTCVTDEQLAAEFEKIKQFPQIALDAEPPGEVGAK